MIRKIDFIIDKFSLYGVLVCVFLMLGLSVFNILMRQFEVTFLWLDPIVRHLVFLTTFLGGVIAVGKHQHIKIDLLTRVLEKSYNQVIQKSVRLIVLLATQLAVTILIYSSYQLVQLELQSDNSGVLGIHVGYLIGIITVGMSLISLRLLTQIGLLFLPKQED